MQTHSLTGLVALSLLALGVASAPAAPPWFAPPKKKHHFKLPDPQNVDDAQAPDGQDQAQANEYMSTEEALEQARLRGLREANEHAEVHVYEPTSLPLEREQTRAEKAGFSEEFFRSGSTLESVNKLRGSIKTLNRLASPENPLPAREARRFQGQALKDMAQAGLSEVPSEAAQRALENYGALHEALMGNAFQQGTIPAGSEIAQRTQQEVSAAIDDLQQIDDAFRLDTIDVFRNSKMGRVESEAMSNVLEALDSEGQLEATREDIRSAYESIRDRSSEIQQRRAEFADSADKLLNPDRKDVRRDEARDRDRDRDQNRGRI